MQNRGRKQPETLFEEFCRQKYESYVEPSRAGTPRGEPVGLSRQKYEACIYMLTSAKLSDIAEWAHVSYALLRKWRTEEIFKRTLDHLAEEFADTAITFVKDSLQSKLIKHKEWLRTIEKKDYPGTDPIMLKKVIDSWNYSPLIREKIRLRIIKEISSISKQDDAGLKQYTLSVVTLAILLGPEREFIEFKHTIMPKMIEFGEKLVDTAQAVLMKHTESPDPHLAIKLFKILELLRGNYHILKYEPKKET